MLEKKILTVLKPEIPEEIQAIGRINGEVQKRFPNLDDITLQAYVNEVVDAIARQNIPVAAVLIDGVNVQRLETIKKEMREIKVRIPTRVIIRFTDGSSLETKFEKVKKGFG